MHEMPAFEGEMAFFGAAEARRRRDEDQRILRPGLAAVEACEAMPPGPELAAELLRVSALALDCAMRIRLAGCWERQRAWTEAQTLVAVSSAAGTPHTESDRWVVADLARAVHVSETTMGNRLRLARRIGDAFPQSYEALVAGKVTLGHVHALDDVTRNAEASLAEAVEADVLPSAIEKGWSPSRLRTAARRSLLKRDPEGAAARARTARRERSDVKLRPEEDDLAALCATGDAWAARQMMDEINRRADALRSAGDNRPLGELRFASLADALLNSHLGMQHTHIHPAQPAQEQGSRRDRRRRTPERARALVLIDLATLLGLADHPGHLDGYGPITAEMARRIAADATLRRLVLDPLSGRPEDLGRTSYEPSPQQRRWIEVRDRHCLFPDCHRRAVYCDIDHDLEWVRGGRTDCDNCGLLCRRHHNFKTKKAWESRRQPDDSVVWTSPHGMSWTTPATTYDYEMPDDIPPLDRHGLVHDEAPPPTGPDDDAYDARLALEHMLWRQAG